MPYTDQGLPFAPHSHTSYQAAVQTAPKRGKQTARYLALVTGKSYADFEAAQHQKQRARAVSERRDHGESVRASGGSLDQGVGVAVSAVSGFLDGERTPGRRRSDQCGLGLS